MRNETERNREKQSQGIGVACRRVYLEELTCNSSICSERLRFINQSRKKIRLLKGQQIMDAKSMYHVYVYGTDEMRCWTTT